MIKLVLGYLLFLNEENVERRLPIVEQSLRSLSTLRGQLDRAELLIVNNGGGELARSVIDDHLPASVPYRCIDLDQNYFDIAVHMCSYWRARDLGAQCFAYAYDDFIFYDSEWISAAVSYIDMFPRISHVRLPQYRVGDPTFDSSITPKSQNPDAVSHQVGIGRQPVSFGDGIIVNGRTFRQCMFLPNSRPTLWRTSAFGEFAAALDDRVPVMQTFEGLMYEHAHGRAAESTGAVLDGGVCRTFPVTTSERTRIRNNCNDLTVSLRSLSSAYKYVADSTL